MLRIVLAILMLAGLSACDSPSVAFRGAARSIVEIDGTRFAIHRRDNKVEIYRTSFEMLPDRARVFALAELAVLQATGCAARKGSLTGDQALMTATLACGGREPAPGSERAHICSLAEGWDLARQEPRPGALSCTPGNA